MKILKLNSKPCQDLANAVAVLQAEQSELVERYERLGREPSGADAQRLRTLASEIADKQEKLRQCVLANPPPPPPPPLKTVLRGNVRLRIGNENTPDPFIVPLEMGLTFQGGGDVRIVTVTSFPPMTTTFDTPLGMNVLTITRDGGGLGTFIASANSLFLEVRLLFDHSINLLTDAHLPLNLTTGSVFSPVEGQTLAGAPLAANGQIGLVASSVFVDVSNAGVFGLGGSPASVQIRGVIQPRP